MNTSLNKFSWDENGKVDGQVVDDLIQAFDIPRAGARFLAAREMTTPELAGNYIYADQVEPHDPFLFANMEQAVDIVRRAVDEKKRILIHGDYDVDGISGTALLYKYFNGVVPHVLRFVPDRRKDGYGIAHRAVDWAIEQGVGLFIAVDCGTSDAVLIKRLKDAGTDVVVCDHHELPADGVTEGVLLNPSDPKSGYPFSGLCGAGVAYKLVCAVDDRGVQGACVPELLLDFVALATVGDVAPLVDENRHFVRMGLELLNGDHRVGLRALRDVARMERQHMTAGHIAFMIAPRLNAPGRVTNPKPALEILCAEDFGKAREFARRLEIDNDYRKELTEKVKDEVLALIRDLDDADQRGGFVLAGDGWDEGVLGIAAARVAEDFGKPTVLITRAEGKAKGSGRSVSGVHLKQQLDLVSGHLSRYGGHAQAVGFSLEAASVVGFAADLTSTLTHAMVGLPTKPRLRVDTEVELEECTFELLDFLATCEPFGHGNRTPVWKIRNATILEETRYVGNGHLKLFFENHRHEKGSAISFNWEERRGIAPDTLHGRRVDIAVTLKRGFFRDKPTLDLHLLDMREGVD